MDDGKMREGMWRLISEACSCCTTAMHFVRMDTETERGSTLSVLHEAH